MKRYFLITIALLVFFCSLVSAQQSWCGQQDAYFNNTAAPDVSGYEALMNFPSGAPEVIENVTVINTGGPKLIDNYIMPVGALTNTVSLEPGVRMFRVYSSVSSASGVTQLNFTAFRRFANGTEQNFYTALSGDINDLVVAEQDFLYVSTTKLMLNPTDRLGIRVSANTTHSSPITVYWYYQGETHYSMFVTGYFDCEDQISTSQNTTYSGAKEGVTPLPVAIFIAIIGILALIGSILLQKETVGIVLAVVSPFPLIVSAWQFMNIDIVTSYGVAALSSNYNLMENHTIYTIYAVSIILIVLFCISLLNIYRMIMIQKPDAEEDAD